MRILFASKNKRKFKELQKDFENNGIELVFYEDEGIQDIPLPESCELLSENAETKAIAAAKSTGMYTLGDDSGIFVEALNNFPGVKSRRWLIGNDKMRNLALLYLMRNKDNRRANLISEFALSDPAGNIITNISISNEFEVANEIKGDLGFGYDPVLIPAEDRVRAAFSKSKISESRCDEIIENKMTIGELTQDEKNAINDRGGILAEKLHKILVEKGILKGETSEEN